MLQDLHRLYQSLRLQFLLPCQSGENLLHLAVRYNRGGLNSDHHFTGREYIPPVPGLTPPRGDNNIVSWLLENPNFIQQNACAEYGKNAFHLAIGARAPAGLPIHFYSENRVVFGPDFVAFASLASLLDNDNYSASFINAPNRGGYTPLMTAMLDHCERSKRTIIYSNGETKETTIIHDYNSDYSDAIRMILESPHLQLGWMFDVKSHLLGTWPDNSSVDESQTIQACRRQPTRNQELGVLVDFCRSGSGCLDTLLSTDCGNMPAEEKATRMVLYCGESNDSYRSTKDCQWHFRPGSCKKESGAILRKLFVKHAQRCIQAVHSQQQELAQSARTLPRRSLLISSLQEDGKQNNRRRAIVEEWERLKQMFDVFNTELFEFFLGGIYSCLLRKYRVPKDNWTNILEFAGWKQEFPALESLPGIPAPKKRKSSSSS